MIRNSLAVPTTPALKHAVRLFDEQAPNLAFWSHWTATAGMRLSPFEFLGVFVQLLCTLSPSPVARLVWCLMQPQPMLSFVMPRNCNQVPCDVRRNFVVNAPITDGLPRLKKQLESAVRRWCRSSATFSHRLSPSVVSLRVRFGRGAALAANVLPLLAVLEMKRVASSSVLSLSVGDLQELEQVRAVSFFTCWWSAL